MFFLRKDYFLKERGVMVLKKLTLLIVLTLTFYHHSANAGFYEGDDSVLQVFTTGEVNWSDMTIRASGTGTLDHGTQNIAVARLGVERAAKLEAIRKLSATIKQIQVDSTTTVDNFMTASKFVNNRVETALRAAIIIDKKFFSDEEVEVIAEISMTGLLTEILIPHVGDMEITSTGNETYTGLIIDATGLGVKPIISPRILDDMYREIYGASYISKEWALHRGIAVYEKDMSSAMAKERVAGNPLIVKAVRTAGSGTNVLISIADSKIFRAEGNNFSFLQQGKVIIVID